MSLLVMGLSHKTAPISLRERLTIPETQLAISLDRLRSSGSLQEVVILSTCNRLEVYARPTGENNAAFAALQNFFVGLYDSPHLAQALYSLESQDAIRHLFRVAAGLESLVVGETDVLGQVKHAYRFAQEHGTTGKITNVLFQRALFVGKAVRNKTNISEGASSVGSIAVQLAEKIFGNLKEHNVLLIGAGKIAEVTARHLLSQKTGRIVVLNRTLARAQELAKSLNGVAAGLEDLEEQLLAADIVICSAVSDAPLVRKEQIESIMKARRGHSLYFIDIAVPRNVDPTVHGVDNVYVYNVDDLKSLVDENLSARKNEIGLAAELVTTMSAEFQEWLAAALEGKDRPLRHHLQNEG